MKLNKYIVASALLTLACTSFGQVKYRRSNLTMVLIEDNSLGKEKDMITVVNDQSPF